MTPDGSTHTATPKRPKPRWPVSQEPAPTAATLEIEPDRERQADPDRVWERLPWRAHW